MTIQYSPEDLRIGFILKWTGTVFPLVVADLPRPLAPSILAVDASQTMIQEYHGDRGVIGFGVAPFSNHTLRVTLVCDEAALDADRGFMCLSSSGKGRSARCRPSPKQPKCKFKLLTVSSC